MTVRRGEPEAALAGAPHRLAARSRSAARSTSTSKARWPIALPLEQDQWLVHSSTQHPGEVQHWVAHALGLENNAVTVECRRMGGGFGGKETQAGHMAVWAALAARKFGRPVKLRLDRDDDFLVTGKRHPSPTTRSVGFDDGGLHHRAQADDAGQLRLLGRPVRPGGRPRGLPRRQRLLPAATSRSSRTAARPTRRATPRSAASAGRRA